MKRSVNSLLLIGLASVAMHFTDMWSVPAASARSDMHTDTLELASTAADADLAFQYCLEIVYGLFGEKMRDNIALQRSENPENISASDIAAAIASDSALPGISADAQAVERDLRNRIGSNGRVRATSTPEYLRAVARMILDAAVRDAEGGAFAESPAFVQVIEFWKKLYAADLERDERFLDTLQLNGSRLVRAADPAVFGTADRSVLASIRRAVNMVSSYPVSMVRRYGKQMLIAAGVVITAAVTAYLNKSLLARKPSFALVRPIAAVGTGPVPGMPAKSLQPEVCEFLKKKMSTEAPETYSTEPLAPFLFAPREFSGLTEKEREKFVQQSELEKALLEAAVAEQQEAAKTSVAKASSVQLPVLEQPRSEAGIEPALIQPSIMRVAQEQEESKQEKQEEAAKKIQAAWRARQAQRELQRLKEQKAAEEIRLTAKQVVETLEKRRQQQQVLQESQELLKEVGMSPFMRPQAPIPSVLPFVFEKETPQTMAMEIPAGGSDARVWEQAYDFVARAINCYQTTENPEQCIKTQWDYFMQQVMNLCDSNGYLDGIHVRESGLFGGAYLNQEGIDLCRRYVASIVSVIEQNNLIKQKILKFEEFYQGYAQKNLDMNVILLTPIVRKATVLTLLKEKGTSQVKNLAENSLTQIAASVELVGPVGPLGKPAAVLARKDFPNDAFDVWLQITSFAYGLIEKNAKYRRDAISELDELAKADKTVSKVIEMLNQSKSVETLVEKIKKF